jgi:hypothetical protein
MERLFFLPLYARKPKLTRLTRQLGREKTAPSTYCTRQAARTASSVRDGWLRMEGTAARERHHV